MKLSSHRRRIHTTTKWLVRQNALPEKFLKELDKSLISRYRRLDFNNYFGGELMEFSNGVISITRQVANHETDRKVVFAYLRMASTVRNVMASVKGFHKAIHHERERITHLVQRIREYIPLKKCARWLCLSESTLRSWITEVRVRCSGSVINLCRKVHPNQLLLSETDAMKKLLNDPDLRFWPLRSVYYHALRKKWVSMSLSTWYCYAKLLGVVRLKPRSVKKYETGIRANQPNEYWHADVSIFKTADGIKHYIYTVVDNFSRFPLTIKVSTKLSGAIRVETFRDAVRKALTIHPTIETVNLIVDGGSENFNGTVDEFLERLNDIEIRRINALKDVAYSNSMAEALNRIIKCSYLNQMNNENTAALEENMKLTEDNYALIRPHAALKGLTPLEAYSGKRPDEISYTPQLKEARKKRIEMNKKYNCGSCRF